MRIQAAAVSGIASRLGTSASTPAQTSGRAARLATGRYCAHCAGVQRVFSECTNTRVAPTGVFFALPWLDSDCTPCPTKCSNPPWAMPAVRHQRANSGAFGAGSRAIGGGDNALRDAFAAYRIVAETHLKHEEDVMMPLVARLTAACISCSCTCSATNTAAPAAPSK